MILKRLLILMAFALPGLACEANHVLGGNITWECLGGDQYEITFTMYKDCYGTPGDPLTESFFFFPSGCASAAFSVDLDYVTAVEISDLCVTEFPNSSCSGGLAPGTMQVTYSGIVTLDPGCTWEAIWNNGSWNYFQNMDNFVAGNPVDAYITAEINTSAPCDDSIDITSSLADPAIEYACFGAPFCHQIDVTNPNAYTLTYTLVNTQTTGAVLGTSMNAPNYTIPAGVTLSATGNLCWTPNLSFGNYVFTVAINMMDGATYIGTMYENVVIVVRNCAPTVTTFNPAGVSSVGNETNQINATSVEACAGDTLQFSVTAVNADLFRAIDLTYTIAPAQPLFTFVQDGINPAVGTFTLITTNAMAGTCYTLTITATDDACPNPDTDVIVISACVRPNLELDILSDTVCVNEAVTLTASGLALPANYSWVAVGDVGSLPSNTGFSQTVTPTETTTYTVSAVGVVIPPLCSSTASATIYVSLSGLTLDPTAETCSNNNGSIDLTIDGDGSGDYCINWTPFGVACDPEDISGLNTGNYNVTVTDNVFGCVANGAANVGDVPAPTLSFTGGTTICAGGQTELCLDLTGGSAPFDITWGSAPPVVAPPDVDDPNGDWQDLPDPFCFFVSPAVTTTYTTATVTDASGCQANVALGQTVTVRPLVTGVILPEGPICNGACVSLNVDYAPGTAAGTYDVVYSIAGTNQIPVPAIDGGLLGNVCPTANTVYDIESISYQNAPLCPSSDAASTGITVVVNPLPTATVSGGVTVCNGACTNLTFTCT
ncbi:MAG: hypothetical protein ACKVOR_08680, partial [Flavobacteriales bacterium]